MARVRGPLLLRQPTHVADAPPAARAIVALAVLLLLALSFVVPPAGAGGAVAGQTDVGLYRGIVLGLRAGGDYYSLAADALRAGGYPLRPFVTFRLPTLSVVLAHVPDMLAGLALRLLVAATFATWLIRLRPAFGSPAAWAAAGVLLAAGLLAFVQPGLAAFHEFWAAPLVALSLGVRRPGRWVTAAALGAAAALIRETAALYLLLMLVFALAERRRDEACGWAAALALFALALGLHAHAVDGVVRPGDPASPGWAGLHGFGLFASAATRSSALSLLPAGIAAPLVALALAGWFAQRAADLRVAATLAAYALAIALFARPDTFYWALMAAPLLPVGLAFCPDLLHDLARPLLDRRRVRVQRITR